MYFNIFLLQLSEVISRAHSTEVTSKATTDEIISNCNTAENGLQSLIAQSEKYISELNHAKSKRAEIRSQIDQNADILNEIQSNLAANRANLTELETKTSIQNQSKQNDIEKLSQVQISTKNELARLEKEIASFPSSPDQKLVNDKQE
jgi:predicted  nucleic acid-binding Zn-ribbon protein